MLSRIEVVMDSGGAISEAGSQEEHFTNGFGGCTAFCAMIKHTHPALYGLYHLSSTMDRAPHMIEDATESNEPFRDWIGALKERSEGQKIHFQLGTPLLFGNDKKARDSHPNIGMERYLKKICAQHGIENYEITLMNMIGVESVSVTEKGMICYGWEGKIAKVNPAKYQTDEELLENLGWTNASCLQYIKADPNVDFDGKLQEKYEQRIHIEQMEKMKQHLELQQKEMRQQKIELAKEIKDSMLNEINIMVTKYQNLFKKEDMNAFYNLLFMEELLKAAKSDDLSSLLTLRI